MLLFDYRILLKFYSDITDNFLKMRNFRTYKNKIISSKRDSQKLDQLELLDFSQVYSLAHINNSLCTLLKNQLHSMTGQNYKIAQQLITKPQNSITSRENSQLSQSLNQINNHAWRAKQKNISSKSLAGLNIDSTQKKIADTQQKDTLRKILDIMSTINCLQQQKPLEETLQNQSIAIQIKEKLSEFKQLMNSIQSKTQSLDFYNEPNQQNHSPNSFNSRSSDEAYQQNTERQAYQFAIDQEKQVNNNSQEIELRYKRINLSNSNFNEENDTFINEEDEDEDLFTREINSEEDQYNRSLSQNSIIHLYSYEKEKYMETPLSSITQRQSENCSPDSKKYSGQCQLSEENLQYKKIQYLLETTEKKRDTSASTHRQQVSQFTINNENSPSIVKKTTSDRDRSRSQSQLMDMINLLENKYNRKIKSGSQNILDSINATLNSKYIRPRQKK